MRATARGCIAGLILFCSACSTVYPHCLAAGAPNAVGQWRYSGQLNPTHTGSPPLAAQLGRPEEIELRADGTFTARFEAAPAGDAAAVPTEAAGERSGHWNGGRFCVEAGLAPWPELGTDPKLPGVASIQLSGSTLLVLGSHGGADDVVYYRVR